MNTLETENIKETDISKITDKLIHIRSKGGESNVGSENKIKPEIAKSTDKPIQAFSPDNGENFGFRVFKDRLVVGYGQSQKSNILFRAKINVGSFFTYQQVQISLHLIKWKQVRLCKYY